MARHLVRSLCFGTVAAALILRACSKPAPLTQDRGSSRPSTARAAAADSFSNRSDAQRFRTVARNSTLSSAPSVESPAEDMPPWLAERSRSPDANVRIQAFEARARQPSASLDPLYLRARRSGRVGARAGAGVVRTGVGETLRRSTKLIGVRSRGSSRFAQVAVQQHDEERNHEA
jgi:hypothetical protein